MKLSRREALQVCLAPVGVAASRWLMGCGDSGTDPEPARDAAVASEDARVPSVEDARVATEDASASKDARVEVVEDASAPADASAAIDASVDVPWASGGTKAMAGNYPDPFAGGNLGMACALYPAQTLGPCYASPVQTREDISDGVTGVPMRMSFLVVASDGCTPVPNAEVDVWSTGSNGVYSAFASGTCNPERIDVASLRYCRGKRSTDASGRVDFNTVFPGWYAGRTIHVHFTVRANGREYLTSQLYFEDALSDELMRQVDYAARGSRNTTNRNDSVLRNADLAPVLFETTKRADGALHAWKVLSIRA